MNKRNTIKFHEELSARSCCDDDEEDIDESSILGNPKSSIRGCASDWDSNAGDRPDSTTEHKGTLREGRRLHQNNNVGNNSTAVLNDGEDDDVVSGASSSRSNKTMLRIFRWWSDVVSRVSRSASSLLNQHSPNLNDILDGGTGDGPLEPIPPTTRRGVQDSIPEDPSNNSDSHEQQEVFALREEVALLKKKIQELEEGGRNKETSSSSSGERIGQPNDDVVTTTNIYDIPSIPSIEMLRPDQISRYSRQLLLNDGFGVSGQKRLLSTSILVIGAGGIGSTVLMYLAAAGVGHITVVDYDCVEMSNLHRQVIHKDENAAKSYNQIGMNKALSAKEAMLNLNPTLSCTALAVMISAENAMELVSRHDVVVDACDNPQTRYLLNDACILAGKPLVSGSAMGTEGQLTVYNFLPATTAAGAESSQPKKRTACYRCLYPNPNPTEGCKSCSDNGVLGMVPGAIGILQAIETIKVVTGIGNVMHDRLLMYDSLGCSFLNVKKPPARPKCAVCSQEATIKSMKDSQDSLDNVRGPSVCTLPSSSNPVVEELSAKQSISCIKYNEVRKSNQPHILLDVRVPRQYEMCSLEGSINLPLEQLQDKLDMVEQLSNGTLPVYCLCRRGIASAEATRIMTRSITKGTVKGIHSVYNITGGLNSWVKTVDAEFPQY